MDIALSTRWNVRRHARGEDLVEEILAAGFRSLELGYDLTLDLVPGIRSMVDQGAVSVVSVHNYCPVPMGVPRGHPELFTFADPDPKQRRRAVEYTTQTVRFAAEMGAGAMVVHGGYVRMRPLTPRLFGLMGAGRQYTPRYERTRMKLEARRERSAQRHMDYLSECLEQMMPVLQETGIVLALENLPTWEAVPNEGEMLTLAHRFDAEQVGFWYDFGHGQIRENLGFGNQERHLERLQPQLAGMHVHDLVSPAQDHVLPFEGEIDFARFGAFVRHVRRLVMEPTRDVTGEQLRYAADRLQVLWDARPPEPEPGSETGGGAPSPRPPGTKDMQ